MTSMENTPRIRERLFAAFRECMGAPAEVFCFAPGRVNLIGEHIDYSGGHVFPCALTLGTYGAARTRTDDIIRLYSLDFPGDGIIESNLSALAGRSETRWGKYVLGVVWAFAAQGLAIPRGFDFVCQGTLPSKAGLSSSASLEVLAGTVLRALFAVGNPSDLSELPLLAQKAENVYVGMNCGIMDQFASANGKEGHAILLDCASLDFSYAPLALKDCSLIIINTNKPHELVDSAYNERRRDCEDALGDLRRVLPALANLCALSEADFETYGEAIRGETRRRRARHAVTEESRTLAAFDALQRNDFDTLSRLMRSSHVSLRDDYEVSCPELDFVAEEAWNTAGVLGARMTGGGFGGCVISIVQNEAAPAFMKKCGAAYRARFGYDASFYTVTAGNGAGVLA